MSTFSKLLGGSRGRILASAAAAVLVLGGIAAVVIGVTSQNSPPAVAKGAGSTTGGASSSTAAPSPTESSDSGSGGQSSSGQPVGPTLPPAEPTAISIPAIGVQSSMFTVGDNPDGTIHVPQPGPNYDKAAWYKGSPMPGEQGPSVIIGHIDSKKTGPSVFYRLSGMQPGQKVSVTRDDGTVAVFTVDKVEKYPKADFPTLKVYGNTDRAEVRLITCGGVFNDSTNNYKSNIVVYGHLTGSQPA